MTTVKIQRVEGTTALHHRYPGQTQDQPAYVELDCETGALGAEVSAEIGPAVPMRVWQGHAQTWAIPALKAEAANALIERIAPLAQRVVDGYESRWDGSNHVARFSDDADLAMDAIEALCEAAGDDATDCVATWEASDWYGGVGSRDAQRLALEISAATSDAELDALADAEASTAKSEGVDEVIGLREYLEALRDEAFDELVDEVEAASEYVSTHLMRRFVKARLAAGDAPDAGALAAAFDAWEPDTDGTASDATGA